MAKAIAIVSGGYNAKEEIKGHGGTWVASAKMWVMTPAGFEKMKSRTQNWGMSAYRAIKAAEGKVVDYKDGVVSEWIESAPVPTPEPAPVAPAFELSAPAAPEESSATPTPAPAKKAPAQNPAERAEVMRASYAAAESFELGGDPLDNLTGQAALFF